MAVAGLCGQLGYLASAPEIATRIGQLLHRGGDAQFVAEEHGKVLAWIHVHASLTLTSAARAEILGLVVDSEARHRGLGRALVRQAERWAQQSGLHVMRVRSQVSRDEAHRFYHASGYRVVKRQEVYDKTLDAAEQDNRDA